VVRIPLATAFPRLIPWLVALLAPSLALTQFDYASISGFVTDPSGAAVPGALITVRNVETGIVRTMSTDESGGYSILNLTPGLYEIRVEKPGFRTYVQEAVRLEIGQAFRTDIQLKVGGVTELVSVTAEIAPLNTESGAIKGDVITGQELDELPLEGRDFIDLAVLVPGVVPKAEGGQGSALTVNGARADSTNFYVDGFNNRNARGAAAQVRPNLNALQEFKMEVSGFSAEYGRMAGGIMNMVLRSGTNQFHGDLFEYVRNNLIDARAYFDPERLKLNRHSFGGTLHGPVILPRLYNGRSRTFFMFSWESYRQLVGVTRLNRVPTPLERQGDFNQSYDQKGQPVIVKDPLARNAPFPGNRIPADRFHPLSVKLLDYYPLPNRAENYNFLAIVSDRDSWDSPIVKLDHHINQNNVLGFRYQIRFNRNSNPFNGSDLGAFGSTTDEHQSLMGLDYTHLFSPAFLVETAAGFARTAHRENCVWAGRDVARQLGFVGSTTEPELLGFPRVTVLDYATLGCDATQPVLHHVTDLQARVKFSWVKSRHSLKWGADISRVRFNQPYFNNNRGTYAFQDRWTGHSMGDFLLGMMQQASRQSGWNRNYMRVTSLGTFFNDDFRVRPNLTLNLGLRYELDRPPVDRYDKIANFMPAHGQTVIPRPDVVPGLDELLALANMTGRIGFANQLGYPRSLVFTDSNNLAPRFGLAWRPRGTQRTVFRTGYGIFYTGHLLNPVRNSLQNQFPFVFSETYSRNSSYPDRVTFSNPFPPEIRRLSGVTSANGYQVDAATGYLQAYSFTIERDLGGGHVLEIGYVGSKGTHLGRRGDINKPRRSIEAFLANIPTRELRPYSFIDGAINLFLFGFNSNYNAGQISLRRRGRGGAFYRLNYAFSKSLDYASQLSDNSNGGYGGFQDPDNPKLERGRSDFDIRHIVTLAFSWQFPVGRGRRWLRSLPPWAEALLGGWQLAGVGSFATGQPFTVTTADIDANLGEFDRPNRLARGVPQPIPGKRRGVDYPWFDINAFEKVPRCDSGSRTCEPSPHGFMPFVPGNSGRNILDGPGQAYLNLALMKNFRLRERRNLRLRLDSFNVLNHPNFRVPGDAFKQFNRHTAGLLSLVAGTGRGGPRVFQASFQYSF